MRPPRQSFFAIGFLALIALAACRTQPAPSPTSVARPDTATRSANAPHRASHVSTEMTTHAAPRNFALHADSSATSRSDPLPSKSPQFAESAAGTSPGNNTTPLVDDPVAVMVVAPALIAPSQVPASPVTITGALTGNSTFTRTAVQPFVAHLSSLSPSAQAPFERSQPTSLNLLGRIPSSQPAPASLASAQSSTLRSAAFTTSLAITPSSQSSAILRLPDVTVTPTSTPITPINPVPGVLSQWIGSPASQPPADHTPPADDRQALHLKVYQILLGAP